MFHPLKKLLQQAPSSKLQPALLLSSSHHLSLYHCGDPHPFTMVEVVVVIFVDNLFVVDFVDQLLWVVVELGVVVFADQLL